MNLAESLAESHVYNPIRDSRVTLGEREILPRVLDQMHCVVKKKVWDD